MRRLNLPLTDKDVNSLKAGESLLLSGKVYTMRDAVHKIMTGLINDKRQLPLKLKGITIYYAGPAPAAPDKIIGSCGPTTSARMDAFTPILLANGVKAMIGKGRRSEEVRQSIKKYKAVYFLAPAGCGALLARRIKEMKLIAYKELGPEAIYELAIEYFPVIVGIDSKGKDVFDGGVNEG